MNQTAPETAAPALQDVAFFDGNRENKKISTELRKTPEFRIFPTDLSGKPDQNPSGSKGINVKD
jgi:hypothetical protein